MIKIYDGEVFSIDLGSYNRLQVLQQCWDLGDCERIKFLVYRGGVLIGAMTYQNLLYEEQVEFFTLTFSELLFKQARKYFYEKKANEGACIPVLNEEGECLFLLEFIENKIFDQWIDGKKLDDFSDLDLHSDLQYLDYTLLNRAKTYVFFEIEEYTYEAAQMIQQKFPERNVYFMDKRAAYFFESDMIKDTLYEFCDYHEKIMFITSERVTPRPNYLPQSVMCIYNSMEIIKSLVWNKNFLIGTEPVIPIIYEINFSTRKAGLAAIMLAVCAHLMFAEERGWIPYINLNVYPNQYLLNEKDNMWEYFFENECRLSEENGMATYVIRATQMDPKENPYLREKYEYLMQNIGNKILKEKIRLKIDILDEIKQKIPSEFWEKDNKIIGVVARGTDYSAEACKDRKFKSFPEEVIEKLIKKINREMKVWGCNYVFIATEDEGYFRCFKKQFGSKVLSVKQERVSYEKGTGMLVSDLFGKTDRIDLAKSYLASMYALSLCFGFLANVDCASTFIVRSWNEGNFAFDETVK